MSKLYLIRGLPGSGKSTLAKHMAGTMYCTSHYEADKYFALSGEYKFDQNQLADAHEWCQRRTIDTLYCGDSVVVSNTFTTIRELLPYFAIAKSFNIVPNVILCQSNYGSIHNVPAETIEKMRSRFVYDLSPLFEDFK